MKRKTEINRVKLIVALFVLSGMSFSVKALDFNVVRGDGQCPAGYTLVTPQEARANQATVCQMVGMRSIVRLAGSGSMGGAGYQCKVSEQDQRRLGASLCKRQEQRPSVRRREQSQPTQPFGGMMMPFFGAVAANGQIANVGSGNWKVRLISTGEYLIVFNQPIRSIPVVMLTPIDFGSTASDDNVFTAYQVSSKGFRVRSHDIAGNSGSGYIKQNADFSFFAISNP